MTQDPKPRYILGKHVPYLAQVIMEATEKFVQKIEDRIADPTNAIENAVDDWTDRQLKRRIRDADEAVVDGIEILRLRKLNGAKGWPMILRRLRLARRSAENRMALALFATQYPELYDRFKSLGPTKLFRLAVIHPSKLKSVHLEDEVETERGKVLLRQLRDVELVDYLRRLVPVEERSLARRLRSRMAQLARLVDCADSGGGLGAADVEELQAMLKTTTLQLARMATSGS
jgi:hypothetical protein